MRTLSARLLVAAVVTLLTAAPSLALEREELPDFGLEWSWPHDGELLDTFDPGTSPYSAGHRGVDVAVSPGDAVRAVADGRVLWAGRIGATAWVTLEHQPGLVSSVGSMDTIAVTAGDTVARGRLLGTTSADVHEGVPRLHVGFRWHGEYFDPLWLLPPPAVANPSLLGPGDWLADRAPVIPTYDDWNGNHRFGFVPGSDTATHAGWLFAPNANHVIGVAGLETVSGSTPIVLEHLGYDRSDITYLSYDGRIVKGPLDPDDPQRDQLPYDGQDTWAGVAEAARRLRDQLRAQWQAHPGQAVDLVGHSMGGLVILHYLATLHDPTDPTLPPIDHVATFASPIRGVGVATAVADAKEGSLGGAVFDAWEDWWGLGLPNSQAVEDVARGSAVVTAIAEMWEAHRENWLRGPLVDTEVATFGGQWDPVVPEHTSSLPDGQHVVLPGTHGSMRDTEAARIALRAFLAGDPIPGEAGGVGHVASHGIDWFGEHLVVPSFNPFCPICALA